MPMTVMPRIIKQLLLHKMIFLSSVVSELEFLLVFFKFSLQVDDVQRSQAREKPAYCNQWMDLLRTCKQALNCCKRLLRGQDVHRKRQPQPYQATHCTWK